MSFLIGLIEELSKELKESARIARALDSNEYKSTLNTSSMSSLGLSSSSKEVEEGEEGDEDLVPTLLDPTEVESNLPSSHILRKCKGKALKVGLTNRKKQGGVEAQLGPSVPSALLSCGNPNVVDPGTEDLAEFDDLLIMQHVQALTKKEYMNQPIEEGNENTAEVGGAGIGTEVEVGGDIKGDGEDQIIPPNCNLFLLP
ncbi:hypothetical protein Acr_10g0009640 [Actinidia rufa]|uniref:Uncharacterized protein n=1 Tax=Actinidia rufa TaxID=165716 RepID=A0A7J0FBM3_9ERIC|nr:hypothetical protein Acr_10g0009640 [Actinidia rufa]